jgi:hypothetical protein
MIHPTGEQIVSGGKQHQGALPAILFVVAAKAVEFLPHARLDDGRSNAAEGDHGFDGADRAAVFEPARTTLSEALLARAR